MTTTETHWFDNRDIFLAVAGHIADNTTDPHDVVYFVEKPWKYVAEAREWANSVLADQANQPPAIVTDAALLAVELANVE